MITNEAAEKPATSTEAAEFNGQSTSTSNVYPLLPGNPPVRFVNKNGIENPYKKPTLKPSDFATARVQFQTAANLLIQAQPAATLAAIAATHLTVEANHLMHTKPPAVLATEDWLRSTNHQLSHDEHLFVDTDHLFAEIERQAVQKEPEQTEVITEPEATATLNQENALQGVTNITIDSDPEMPPPSNRKNPPSEAMINFQRSFRNLSEDEQRQLLKQVTPSTARASSSTETPANGISNISTINAVHSFFLQTPEIPLTHTLDQPVYYNNATYHSEAIFTTDPLLALMSKPRHNVLKDLIKELANAALAATEALKLKMHAAQKLLDPSNDLAPRSIRNKNFTLTTIEEFKGHQEYKKLVMKAAGICAQWKENLTATVKELAMKEIAWLKILRVQRILKQLKPIIASLVFRLEKSIPRPTLPALVKANTLQFFLFYWLVQMNIKQIATKQTNKCYLASFDLPFNDIVAIAANFLIENSPQAIADVIENLNKATMEWDTTNQHTGYYVTLLAGELNEIITTAVFDHVTYHQSLKAAKEIEAETQAYVNKLRVKSTTELTNATLDKVTNQATNQSINEKDLRKRQDEVETTVAKATNLLHSIANSQQQKNSSGSSSAQRPNQLKPNQEKNPSTKPTVDWNKSIRFIPAWETEAKQTTAAKPTSEAQQETTNKKRSEPSNNTEKKKKKAKKRKPPTKN